MPHIGDLHATTVIYHITWIKKAMIEKEYKEN